MRYDIKIRYNTLCTDDKNYWRILVNGKEYTCTGIQIQVPTTTTRDDVWDENRGETVNKHHISCKVDLVEWNSDGSVTLRNK